MVTEADYNLWTEEQLEPYFDVVFEAFGPERLMFGSDWPVCLVASNYKNWIDLVDRVMEGFSENEKELFWFKNAEQVYQL